MYFLALAADFDGTIAHDGVVHPDTCGALQRLKETGRRLILVTGRELPSLQRAFPEVGIFDLVVAENGALLYEPATRKEHVIAAAPPAIFVERLKQRNVAPLSVGHSIVATWEPNQATVLEVIRELGLELQIIFNKGAVMILPPGMNKAVGLDAALAQLELSPHNVVGVGDAQNDHAFLHSCGCSAAVANALPMVKEAADIRLAGDHGAGVIELANMISRDDIRILKPERHTILVGKDRNDQDVYLEPYAGSVLIAGSSGIGKSTLAIALTERMAGKKFEFCVFDPEGDYHDLENAVSVGDAKTPPPSDEALKLIRSVGANVVVNTQAFKLAERPPFFADLLPKIASLRARTGRPHWLLIDEAHHLLPAARGDVSKMLPDELPATIFITVHPEALAPDALEEVETVLALGDGAPEVLAKFAHALGIKPPKNAPKPGNDEVLCWLLKSARQPFLVKAERPQQVHKRHTRKYAEGDLGEDRSFYFRGPDNKLNLRAQNLMLFLQMADGVDDITFDHHLRRGDYSSWFRHVIKNEELAREAATIEADESLGTVEARKRLHDIVADRYTAPTQAV